MAPQPLVIRRNSWHFRFWCFCERKWFDRPWSAEEGPPNSCTYYVDLATFFVTTILFPTVVIAALGGLIWVTITKFWVGVSIIGTVALVVLLLKMGLGRSIANRYRANVRRLCRPIEIVDGVADRGVARNEG